MRDALLPCAPPATGKALPRSSESDLAVRYSASALKDNGSNLRRAISALDRSNALCLALAALKCEQLLRKVHPMLRGPAVPRVCGRVTTALAVRSL